MGRKSLAVFCLALVLCPSRPLAAEAEPPYDAKSAPLSARQSLLLSKNGYQARQDGSLWLQGGSKPVSRSEMPFLLQRLESGQRLKALLELQLILSRSAGEKRLTPAEREEIRRIVRENWPFFLLGTRKDFKSYFALEELAQMNKDPAPNEGVLIPQLADLEPVELPETGPPPSLASASPSFQAPGARLPALLEPLKLRAVAAAPQAAPPVPRAGGPLPQEPTLTAQAPEAASAPKALPPSEEAAQRAPEAASQPPQAAATPPPQAPEVPEAALPPPPREISQAEFEKFLLEAPYRREVKSLLRLISAHAPAPARNRALGVVMSHYPQVLHDSSRAEGDGRGTLLVQEDSSGQKSYLIVLSPGPLLHLRKKLFSRTTVLLPETPGLYASLHLPPPALEAARGTAVAVKQETGPWGETRLYSDDSRRGSFSPQQQAGTLLLNLLRLEAKLRGWEAWPYAREVYARTAQWLFHASLQEERFLDPQTRQAYRLWLQDPAEYRDHLVHALSSGRARLLDPRRAGAPASCEDGLAEQELREGLKKDALAFYRAGLAGSRELAEAQKAIEADSLVAQEPCAKRLEREALARRLASGLLAEIGEEERKFREGRKEHESR